jgi:hypothetical protein
MPVPEPTSVATGQRLTFSVHPGERAHIFRRVGRAAGPWHRVAVYARCPFVDKDVRAPGTAVEYYAHVPGETAQAAPRDRSHLLRTVT